MPRKPLHRVQAATVARRHFVGRQNKSDIAKDLALSRFKVARLIEEAIEDGIVTFVINEPSDLDADLSEALRHRFGLSAALVLRGPATSARAAIEPLGALAAQLLEETLSDGQVLGVAWGRTLAAMARALTQLPKVDVVQVAGNPTGLEYTQHPVELVHRIAGLSGGRPHPIYAPMWVEDASVADLLRGDADIARALALCDRLDVLVVGIGSWAPPESCLCAGFPAGWLAEAMRHGVRSDICKTLIDDAGHAVDSPLDRLGIGMTNAQLRRVPQVIGIGGGLEKADAILAALRGGWIHTLVTDSGVARHLLT